MAAPNDSTVPPIAHRQPIAGRSEVPAPRSRPSQTLLWWLTLGYSAFVIYGSLVPLQFRRQPLDKAWEYFQRIPYLDLGIGSRADWVANILLFIPLAFLWLGLLWPRRSRIGQTLVSAVVLLGCFGLSVVIEFTQIFFPPRTVSLNDIIAETLGAIIGMVVWLSTGSRVMSWLAGWSEAYTPKGTTERLLYGYLFLLFGYSVMPLDLTISFVEIFHKWREGKVLLVPFSAHYDSGAQRTYALLADTAIWIPAAFLWKLSSSHSARKIVLYVLAFATIIEILQLFVYSRVTSTTDVLMAGCGGLIGVALAAWLRPNTHSAAAPRATAFRGGYLLLWMLAFAAWVGVLMIVFWYPFDFNTGWGFVHQRVAELKRVPFEAYYFGTEFRAVTEVFHKTGFFFPLGALLALGTVGIRRRWAVPAVLLHAASVLIIAGAAAGIEIGQLFLPGKIADTTDWFLETFGGLLGYVCMRIFIPHWQTGREDAPAPPAVSGKKWT